MVGLQPPDLKLPVENDTIAKLVIIGAWVMILSILVFLVIKLKRHREMEKAALVGAFKQPESP